MDLFNNKISINTLLFDGHFIQKDEFIIQKTNRHRQGFSGFKRGSCIRNVDPLYF